MRLALLSGNLVKNLAQCISGGAWQTGLQSVAGFHRGLCFGQVRRGFSLPLNVKVARAPHCECLPDALPIFDAYSLHAYGIVRILLPQYDPPDESRGNR